MTNLNELIQLFDGKASFSRRHWLAYCSALASIPLLGRQVEGRVVTKPSFAEYPFALGVASGDPSSAGVVLWTRLAPRGMEPGGGLRPDLFEVQWVVAEDEAMQKVVKKGKSLATPQLGHSVHVEVNGLKPDHWYYYQFTSGDAKSPVGRTRTMPAQDQLADKLKFAFASCQHYEQGLYTAYEQMIKDAPDLVFHLGDYIYEGPGRNNLVRKHQGEEIKSLDDYRTRYAQYRLDPLLAGMHAACPWVVTWDDHEFDNNCAGAISEEKNVTPAEFLKRRANAYQAYYEMMPLRARSVPSGPDLVLYRTIRFGRLAEFFVLDTRQYRSDQPNDDRSSPLNENARNPKNTLLGSQQGKWLKNQLLQSGGLWNVLAQQIMMGVNNISRDDSEKFSMDQWPGYLAERADVLGFMDTRKVPNPVVLTGDIHSNWVNDLRVEPRGGEGPCVATEFVGTSISSGGDGVANPPYLDLLKSKNPDVKYFGAQRGYVLCTVTPEKWLSDYRVVEQVTKPGGPVATKASFVVEVDQPGAKPA